MPVYRIKFNYRVLKNRVIPIDFAGAEIAVKITEPLNNALEFDWSKVVKALYPDYMMISITKMTTSAVLEEQQA